MQKDAFAPPALELTAIRKQFGETMALDDASFSLRAGTVHALLGENGAGKTTLMRIVFGLTSPDRGTVNVDGVARRFTTPRDAIHAGIGMVHQHFMLVPSMTVAENVALGGTGRYDAGDIVRRIGDVSAQYGLMADPNAEVGTLSVSAQQRVEILKALVYDAQILILDEPTAVLAPEEARTLLVAMRDFASRGGSVVLITHKLRDALEFADDITVLRRGRTVFSSHAGVTTEAELAGAMLGAPGVGSPLAEKVGEDLHTSPHPERVQRSKPPVLALHDATIVDARGVAVLEHVSLAVHAGEIVGIAAVEGNGQHELLRVLANRLVARSGRVTTPDTVGFVPEDRHRDALVLDFPLDENLALAGAGARRGTIAWNTEREQTNRVIQAYDVRTSGPEAIARTLSGGNQQKLVIGRELSTAPTALVVENPTRGLDVQATATVHARLRGAAEQGTAVVVYCSDLDEVLALADRIVVLYGGRLSEVPLGREMVGNAMLGRGTV